MWKNFSKLKTFIFFLILMLTAFLFPLNTNAAQILQVRTPTQIVVGDNNRSYTVQIACLEIDSNNEEHAKDFIKSMLPRRKRVNLYPIGSKDGTLLARVTPIGENKDISSQVADAALGKSTC